MKTFNVISNTLLSENTFKLRVERPKCEILAGQCFNIGLPGLDINREYSMYSSADADYIDFIIRRVEGGLVSERLFDLKVNDKVELDGPYGAFLINEDCIPNNKFMFVATGTGIAPFHSFVSTYSNLDYKVIHGIRLDNESYDYGDYGERYFPCVSKPLNSKNSQRVTDFLQKIEISNNTLVYICGNRNMISDVYDIVHGKGVFGDSIFTETFF